MINNFASIPKPQSSVCECHFLQVVSIPLYFVSVSMLVCRCLYIVYPLFFLHLFYFPKQYLPFCFESLAVKLNHAQGWYLEYFHEIAILYFCILSMCELFNPIQLSEFANIFEDISDLYCSTGPFQKLIF